MVENHSALSYVARPSVPGRPVLLLHSWWGLTSAFPEFADRLASRGLLVGCVDLYDGVVARSTEEVSALRRAPRREPMCRSLLRGLAQLREDPACDGSDPGLVGFSMGGHWALWLAQHADPGVADVVVYYAARAVRQGGPVAVLCHFADRDPYVSATARRTMQRSFQALDWPYTSYDYPRTGHWFAESSQASYDHAAATTAFERTSGFLLNL